MKALLYVLALLAFMGGALVMFHGFSYFVAIDPQFEHWLKLFAELDPDRAWIIAGLIGCAGLFLGTVPITFLLFRQGLIVEGWGWFKELHKLAQDCQKYIGENNPMAAMTAAKLIENEIARQALKQAGKDFDAERTR